MMRTCPRCGHVTASRWCCGLELSARRRRRWRLTRDMVRAIHVVARSRKGLTEEQYRLRLAALGVDSCKQLDREGYHQLMDGLNRLPDVPRWAARGAGNINTEPA